MIRPILFNTDMERVANNMLPIMVKFLIESGMTVCLLSIIIAIYAYVKKKSNLKTIRTYFIITFSSGALASICGAIVHFMANFDIDFSTYKVDIPLYLIVSLIIFSSIMKIKNNQSN